MNEKIYFVFAPKPQHFYPNHPRIKYLDIIVDLDHKRQFIDTCDAMIHARSGGESFGISVLEFVFCGKPVFTTFGYDNQHIINLGEAGILYDSKDNLVNKMLSFTSTVLQQKQNKIDVAEDEMKYKNVLEKFSPHNVMKSFSEIFLQESKSEADTTQ
jgi:glycosyltransferase involved in cell wall biosynthesis